jgi:hypothetical protein
LLDSNGPIVGTIPVFVTKASDLKLHIDNVHGKDLERQGALTGKAQDKYDAEDKLIAATILVAGPMFTYGSDNNLNDVMEAASVTRSQLRSIRDTELSVRCKQVRDMANTHAAALVSYGVTAAMIAEIVIQKTAFETALGERESATAQRSGAIVTLKGLFKDGMKTLEQMDGLVETFNMTEPQFFSEYHFARVIRDLGQSIHTFTGNVGAGATANILNSGFGDTTQFSLENTGTTNLRFCTAGDATTACTRGVQVNPGQIVIRRANEIGVPGSTFLNVTNLDGVNAGSYKVVRL